MKFALNLLLGFAFGAVLIGSGAFSWTAIYEMFHFASFHMYGLLFSAILTAALGVFLIRRFQVKSVSGKAIVLQAKAFRPANNLFGGLLFGLGWGISGACSAPIYILVGVKWTVGFVLLGGAIFGTVLYALNSFLVEPKKQAA